MSARILIVDDIKTNVEVLELKLQLESYQILTAFNGYDALKIAEDDQPDLIILDVMMPGLDGFETCQRLKANPKTKDIPVLMLTALTDKEDRLKGLKSGADDFLTKPIQDTSLMARVKSLIRLKMTMDEWMLRASISKKISSFTHPELEEVNSKKATIFLFSSNKAEKTNISSATKNDEHQIILCHDFEDLIHKLSDMECDLILVDLAYASDLELCKQLKSYPRTRFLPLLAFVEEEHTDLLFKGIELGINDYLLRPLDNFETYLRIRGQIKRWRYHQKLKESLETSFSPYLDKVTQLYNTQFAFLHIQKLLEKMHKTNKNFSIILLNIDFYSKFQNFENESFRALLSKIANEITDIVRDFDLVAHYKENAFLVVLPETDIHIAQKIAERIDQKIQKKNLVISFTVSCASKEDKKAEDLIVKAEKKLNFLENYRINVVQKTT